MVRTPWLAPFRYLALASALALFAAPASAAPKKYHFELLSVSAKPEVKPDVAKAATPRIEAQVKSVFASHPQLVANLEGAPDPKTAAEAYRKYLVKKAIAAAYLVSVDITEASEELEPVDKPNTQRLVIHVAIHMLGENIPGRTMGFTGDGKATIKQEVGVKVRDADRQDTWNDAAKIAVDDAMAKVFKQLGQPQPKK
ncbi:MAG TPA: hypothetical protein VFP84_12600 [Kofleriaceae bacterium]|nr:hypothetical protein [Kofleriaceae bacterium]